MKALDFCSWFPNIYFKTNYGVIINDDCFNIFPHIPNKSIDLILADLPYGTTKCKWDSILPLDKLWEQYERIIKDNGAIILFAKQPFTSQLVNSNLRLFRYEAIWQKEKGTDFANANCKFLNAHENILFFYKHQPTYNIQYLHGDPYTKKNYRNNNEEDLNFQGDNSGLWINNGRRTPTTVLKFARDNIHYKTNLHPTQKPVALLEYLIKTYSNENDLAMDNTAGVCSTGVAAENTKRYWICIEKELEYCVKAKNRFDAKEAK
jgi:site-specific DNA-methyltransferase (adenine-specific)